MAVRLDLRPIPPILPGYTGHCPQHKYHKYLEYGGQNHKLVYPPHCKQFEQLVNPPKCDKVKHLDTLLERIQKYSSKEQIAAERARKYHRMPITKFKIPAKGYDPYDVTTGLDTIYTKEGVIANYSGHLPAKHIFVSKTNHFIARDAKKSLRWEVNGEGWEWPVVEHRVFLRYKKKTHL